MPKRKVINAATQACHLPGTATTNNTTSSTSTVEPRSHSPLFPLSHEHTSPARNNDCLRQKFSSSNSLSREPSHNNVAMEPGNQLTHPHLPPPTNAPADTDSISKPILVTRSMAEPNLSPRHIPLPPSPPFDSDSDNEDSSRRENPLDHTVRTSRHQSDSSLSTKPVIHQQSPPIRARNQSPSTPPVSAQAAVGIGLALPMMQRAHSSPGVDSSGQFITPQYHNTHNTPRRPASPLTAGSRRRSPLRTAMEESYPSWSGLAIEPNIPEHAELDLSEDYSHISPIPTYHNTFPRSRRRPASPLHPSASAPSLHPGGIIRAVSPHTTGTSSPGSSGEKRYYVNESYPATFGYSYSSTSSMPSTPSSFRSRSPSISSLETIEDSPDAEEAAMVAAEEDAKYKVEDVVEAGEGKRRGSLEIRGNTLRSNKERKRWSVCGAERRADFSLEVIEE